MLDEHYFKQEWRDFAMEWAEQYSKADEAEQLRLSRSLLVEYRDERAMIEVISIMGWA